MPIQHSAEFLAKIAHIKVRNKEKRRLQLKREAKEKAVIEVVQQREKKAQRGSQRVRELWIRYKLTPEQHQQILRGQGGACAICGERKPGKELGVDHDHRCCPIGRSCGKCIRGLLCLRCNLAIGNMDDDPVRLAKAIAYLKGSIPDEGVFVTRSRVAVYARVSTDGQSCEMQLKALREYCAHRDWAITEEYIDEGVSGAKTSRPAFDRMKKDANKHKFEVLLVWKFDRFARSLAMLILSLAEFRSLNIDFVSATEQFDTTTAVGRALFGMIGVFGEFEREMISARTRAGRQVYQAAFDAGEVGSTVHSKSGKDLPPHRPTKIWDRQKARDLHAAGQSVRSIAARLEISFSSVHRALRGSLDRVSKAGDGKTVAPGAEASL